MATLIYGSVVYHRFREARRFSRPADTENAQMPDVETKHESTFGHSEDGTLINPLSDTESPQELSPAPVIKELQGAGDCPELPHDHAKVEVSAGYSGVEAPGSPPKGRVYELSGSLPTSSNRDSVYSFGRPSQRQDVLDLVRHRP